MHINLYYFYSYLGSLFTIILGKCLWLCPVLHPLFLISYIFFLVLLSNYEITGANNFLRKCTWDHKRFSYPMIFYLGKWCYTGNNFLEFERNWPLFSSFWLLLLEKDPAILISCYQGFHTLSPPPPARKPVRPSVHLQHLCSLIMTWLRVIHCNHA